MRYNFETLIMGIDGTEARDQTGTITFRRGISTALLTDFGPSNGDEKGKRFALALKVQSATEETDFPVEEAKMIKDHIGVVSPTLIVGRVQQFIESGKNPEA